MSKTLVGIVVAISKVLHSIPTLKHEGVDFSYDIERI
jgi:hypothetical protein